MKRASAWPRFTVKGTVLRDLKPANLFLCATDSGRNVFKVMILTQSARPLRQLRACVPND